MLRRLKDMRAGPHLEHDGVLHSTAQLLGCRLQAPDGAIGRVEDFLVDDATGQIADLVVDTRPILNIGLRIALPGGRHVLVAPTAVARIDLPERKVHVRLTCDEIRNSPSAKLL